MSRYIDVDKLLVDENMHTLPNGNGRASGRVVVFIEDIENAPTADVQEVRHGKWIQNKYLKYIFYCSICGRCIECWSLPENTFPYCHCGARMDLKGEQE